MQPAAPTQTPEFLCWAIEHRCPLREMLPENNPEKVERQLRAARAVAEARSEGRVQDNRALSEDGRLGFDIAAALELYGGEAAVAACCNDCPANVREGRGDASYAGCFGLLPMPEPREEFLERVQQFAHDEEARRADAATLAQPLFQRTRWLWYGWWMRSPLEQPQLDNLEGPFLQLSQEPAYAENRALHDFVDALVLTAHQHLPLSVQLFPAGEIEGTWWNLQPHCPVCRAPWQVEGGVCAMCGQSRHPASPRKRRIRGIRPYRPLEELA
jgi:hypothetical protein